MCPDDARERKLAQIRRLAKSGLRLEPFARAVLDVVLDGVAHCRNGMSPFIGRERTGSCTSDANVLAEEPPPRARFVAPSDTRLDRNGVPPSGAIEARAEINVRDLDRGEACNVIYRPPGGDHPLQVVFHENGEWIGYCPIWCETGQKPLSREDRALIRAAAPHVAQGLKTAQLMRPAQGERDDFAPLLGWKSGVILTDENSRALALDTEAGLIFQQLAVLDGLATNRLAGENSSLVLEYAAKILNGALPRLDRDNPGTDGSAGHLYHHWAGIVLKLRGFKLKSADGLEYFAVTVERGEASESRQRRLLIRWELSEREAEVLSWLLEGKTGLEISSLLGVGHDTVRKHTSRIFEKLGVENRMAAAAIAREFVRRGA